MLQLAAITKQVKIINNDSIIWVKDTFGIYVFFTDL